MQNIIAKIRRAPLTRNVCLIALAFGLVVTFVAQGGKAYFDYHKARNDILNCVSSETESNYDRLSETVWQGDRTRALEVLRQIEQHCHSNIAEFLWEISLRKQKDWLSRGVQLQQSPIDKISTPLSYWREQVDGYGIGSLELSLSFSKLKLDVTQTFWHQFMMQAAVLLACATLAFLLGYRWFVRSTQTILEQGLDRPTEKLLDNHILSQNTELSAVWKMIFRIRTESEQRVYDAQKQVERTKTEYESALKDVEAKNQFISSLSHDLRTPMNGLIGFSALLSESELNETQREYATTIQASLESLLHVINDVLDLSRVESGDLHVHSIPFSMRGVVSGVISLLRARAHAKGIKLETRISMDIPAYLRGDPARIRQLLTNLVSHAIKYTVEGHILIELEVIRSNKDECKVRVAVEDTGFDIDQRGQSASQLEQLGIHHFSRELRSKRSISLDASEQLAQLMNSHVNAENAETRGVTYWFDLNLPIVQSEMGSGVLDRTLLSDVHAIVFDVFSLSRGISLELLQSWNVTFDSTQSIAETKDLIEMYKGGKYLLVLLDDRGQTSDAYESVRQLSQLMGKQGGTIVLSGYPQLGDAERYFLAGAKGFLSKQDRDPYLRDVMCQVYAESRGEGSFEKRLVTRYTVQDLIENPLDLMPVWNVLVVEENIVNQQILVRALEQSDCRIDIATNGFEAIELFKSARYDLILMDCEMSEMDGFETTQILMEIERSGKSQVGIPIIGMLSSGMDGEDIRCFDVGMKDVLYKPIKLSALQQVLTRHLEEQ